MVCESTLLSGQFKRMQPGLLSPMSFVKQSQYFCSFSLCYEGRWDCKSLPSPATCAVEEGSHVTTFDGKAYIFHGNCHYILAKIESKVHELMYSLSIKFSNYNFEIINFCIWQPTLVCCVLCVMLGIWLYLWSPKCTHALCDAGWGKPQVHHPGPVGPMCEPWVWHLSEECEGPAEQWQKQCEWC